MSETKLRPCPNPWCDPKNTRMMKKRPTVSVFWVRCMCGVCGPSCVSADNAIAAWNNRPLEDELLEALKACFSNAKIFNHDEDACWVPIRDMCRAVIAKEEGFQ